MTITRERATFSLWGAAYAMAKGVRVLRVIHESGTKAIIYLEDTYDQSTQALQEYWADVPIGPRTLIEARATLLDMVQDAKRQTKETKEKTPDAEPAAN